MAIRLVRNAKDSRGAMQNSSNRDIASVLKTKLLCNQNWFRFVLDSSVRAEIWFGVVVASFLVACTQLYKPLCWSVCRSVCRLVGRSVAEDSEHATYGNRPCCFIGEEEQELRYSISMSK